MGANKLTVTTNTGVINLSGVMDDAMEVYGLSEALQGKFASIDFQSIRSASWNSLLRFDGLVRASGASQVKLEGLSYGIFRLIRMLDGFAEFYTLGETEAPFLASATKAVTYKKVSKDTFESIFFDPANAGLAFFGRDQHFYALSPDFVQSGPWDTTRLSSVSYDYCLFAEIIFILVSDLAEGVRVSIGRVMDELKRKVGSVGSAAGILNIPLKTPLVFAELQIKIANIENGVTEMSRSIGSISDLCRERLTSLAIRLSGLAPEQEPETISVLKELAVIIKESKPIATQAEDFGVLVGELFEVYELKSFEPAIVEAIDKNEDPEVVQNIIDTFCIMDPMAEEKDVLIEGVKECFMLLETEVGKVSTISQSCDLMRQIVEHRINEALLVESLIESMGESLIEPESTAFFRSELTSLIEKKMVTDQEKFAMKFFMPKEGKATESSAQPGDSLFF